MLNSHLIADMREQFKPSQSAQLELSPKIIKGYIDDLRYDIKLCEDIAEYLEKDVKALQRVLSLPLQKVLYEFSSIPVWYHE